MIKSVEIEQRLFHDDTGWAEIEKLYAAPQSTVGVGLDELMQISERKRLPPRLTSRKIQIPGRRMERFSPPILKPRRGNLIGPMNLILGASSQKCGDHSGSVKTDDVIQARIPNQGERTCRRCG
jgi:hypothetical protein